VGSEEWILLARKASDIKDTLEPTRVRIDNRQAVAAQAMQLPDEMLVAVDSQRSTQFVARGDRVCAGRLFAKDSAVQRLPQQLEHPSHVRATPTRRDDAGVAVGQHYAVVPAVERCGHLV